jgi:stress response protein YsnF
MPEPLEYPRNLTNTNPYKLTDAAQRNIEIVAQETIQLLEEQLVVETSKHKVGEVIVRKVVETRMVKLPVKREKLIVEQVYPEYKQLAAIAIGEGEFPEIDLANTASANGKSVINGEFNSPTEAIKFLEAIALDSRCQKVKIEVTIDNVKHS